MRLGATKASATTSYNGLGDQLYDLGGARPTLDLNFSSNESLVDSVTGKTLVDHTRASRGTYVDGDGVIRTAVANHIRNSEDLTATGWNLNGSGTGSAPVVTADAGIAPDGTQTAWQVDFDKGAGITTSDQSNIFSVAVETTADKRVFHSVYLKTTDGSTKTLRFDLNGANPNVTGYTTYTITVTGEWQRFIIGYDSTITGRSWALRLRGTQTPDDQPTASVYFWHPQTELLPINTGSPGEYVPNLSSADLNSAPRFDHDPTTGESLGLLVEESRSNIAISSQAFGGAPYATDDATILDNQTIAPDGTLTAASFLENAPISSHNIGRDLTTKITSTAGTIYTFSVFVKPNGRSFVQVTSNTGDVAGNPRANFDIANGVLGTVDSGAVASISRFPNGWVRLTYTVTAAASSINFYVVAITSSTAARFESFAGDVAKGFYIWGYCLEVGSFSTSYIPTEGSPVTRAADVVSITGTNFSSWYEQSAGTVAISWNKPWGGNWSSYPSLFRVIETANSSENYISYGSTNGANNQIYWGAVTSNVSQLAYKQYPATGPGKFKHAIAVTTDDAAFALAGDISGRTDDSITLPTVDKAQIDAVNSHISRLTYWPTRLSNDTLQTITT